LLDFLRAYKTYDPAAKSLIEVALLYPGPKAILFYRIGNLFYRLRFFFLARLVCELARLLTGIEIHPGAKIGRRLVIDHGMGIVIGETTIIGDDCLLFQGATLGGVSFEDTKRHPTLANNVVIGSGAKVLGPIEIGAFAKVGSNAVVTKSVPAHTTVVGIPARPLEIKTTTSSN